MACFIAAVAEGAVVYTLKRHLEHKAAAAGRAAPPLVKKLSVLLTLLLGGSFLLLIEHVWHGEIVPFYPFLTAMESPEQTRVMLHEIMTVGLSMDLLLTLVWGIGCLAADILQARRSERA